MGWRAIGSFNEQVNEAFWARQLHPGGYNGAASGHGPGGSLRNGRQVEEDKSGHGGKKGNGALVDFKAVIG
jgi:hypothetical protein